MKSCAFSRQIRFYSKPTGAVKLWVKPKGDSPTKVSTKGCIDLDDFAKKIKQELKTSYRINFPTPSGKDYLDPGLQLSELFKTYQLESNSSQNPLPLELISPK